LSWGTKAGSLSRAFISIAVRATGLLPGAAMQGDGQAGSIAADVEPARVATARAAKTLPMSPSASVQHPPRLASGPAAERAGRHYEGLAEESLRARKRIPLSQFPHGT